MYALLAVNNYYYPRGGAETLFLEENRLFQAAGWRVVPFAMRHPDNLETPWSEYFVDDIEFGAHYTFLQKARRVPKVIYSLEARRKLARLLDGVAIDICHLHNIYHHISPSILGVLKRRGIPMVLTLHDLKVACPAYKMLARDGVCERCREGRLSNLIRHRCIKGSLALSALAYLEARIHRALATYRTHVDRFIVPSLFYLEKLTQWGVPREKLIHIPNFVDVTAFQPRSEMGRAFLFVGRLSPEKGVATLVRAAAMAGVPLRIAGAGSEERHLRDLADRLGAQVEFLGHLSGKQLKGVMREARAVVVPSEWYENAPMCVLEAYATAVPVLGAAIGGIGELIREGETGATFSSGSVESLADKLRWFAQLSDARIAEMGRAGRAWVEEAFTSERYRCRLIHLFAQLGVVAPEHAGPLYGLGNRANGESESFVAQ